MVWVLGGGAWLENRYPLTEIGFIQVRRAGSGFLRSYHVDPWASASDCHASHFSSEKGRQGNSIRPIRDY